MVWLDGPGGRDGPVTRSSLSKLHCLTASWYVVAYLLLWYGPCGPDEQKTKLTFVFVFLRLFGEGLSHVIQTEKSATAGVDRWCTVRLSVWKCEFCFHNQPYVVLLCFWSLSEERMSAVINYWECALKWEYVTLQFSGKSKQFLVLGISCSAFAFFFMRHRETGRVLSHERWQSV